MHELSVTQNILDIALRHAEKSGAKRIAALNITIGELSSIIDDSVQFYWEIISKGTLAEDSTLNFKRIPTTLLCLDCNHQYSPENNEFSCPVCNSSRIKIVAGREFFLESIEIV